MRREGGEEKKEEEGEGKRGAMIDVIGLEERSYGWGRSKKMRRRRIGWERSEVVVDGRGNNASNNGQGRGWTTSRSSSARGEGGRVFVKGKKGQSQA